MNESPVLLKLLKLAEEIIISGYSLARQDELIEKLEDIEDSL